MEGSSFEGQTGYAVQICEDGGGCQPRLCDGCVRRGGEVEKSNIILFENILSNSCRLEKRISQNFLGAVGAC
jgi:hypothetical protein